MFVALQFLGLHKQDDKTTHEGTDLFVRNCSFEMLLVWTIGDHEAVTIRKAYIIFGILHLLVYSTKVAIHNY